MGPNQECLSLYKGTLRKIGKFGNKGGDIEHLLKFSQIQ